MSNESIKISKIPIQVEPQLIDNYKKSNLK